MKHRNPVRLLLALAVPAMMFMPSSASAISVDLAKKCQGLALEAHPPARAGSKTGAGRPYLEYYRTCVANNGTMPQTAQKASAK